VSGRDRPFSGHRELYSLFLARCKMKGMGKKIRGKDLGFGRGRREGGAGL
jgi:hypothetical protein